MTLRELLNIIKNLLIRPEEPVFPEELPCEELLELAHQELAAAETIFAENDDPDMIDFTVYNLKTAEARTVIFFTSCVKRAKKAGMSLIQGMHGPVSI